MRRKASALVIAVIGGLAVGVGIAVAQGEPTDEWLPPNGGIIRAEDMPNVLPLAGPNGQVVGYIPNPALYDVPFPPPAKLIFRTNAEATAAVARGEASRRQ
jgi:hypothetical protein